MKHGVPLRRPVRIAQATQAAKQNEGSERSDEQGSGDQAAGAGPGSW